jgi:hypothetical protein
VRRRLKRYITKKLFKALAAKQRELEATSSQYYTSEEEDSSYQLQNYECSCDCGYDLMQGSLDLTRPECSIHTKQSKPQRFLK